MIDSELKHYDTMTRKIGILSDTHLADSDRTFCDAVEQAFSGCDTIIHAGDITNLNVLNAFSPREILAVHGNMCNLATKHTLPEHLLAEIGGYRIAVCHGDRGGHDIEGWLFTRFPEADCIIYGHTHRQSKNWYGNTLVINPGSFSSGTYAILEIDAGGLTAHLLQLDR